MLSLKKNGYTEQQVRDQLHSRTGSRTTKFRFDLLNRYNIKIGELTAQPSGTITLNSLAQIKRTGQFTFKENEIKDIEWLNDRVQPFLLLKMFDGKWIEWPLGIFLMSSPIRQEDSKIMRSVDAYDLSLILLEDKFISRYRIAAGTKYIDAIHTILNSAGIWRINITGFNSALNIDKEFEIGVSKLEAVNTLLKEINYTSLWVDENGYFTARPYVLPKKREAEYSYKNNEISVIEPGVSEELDIFNIPNVWVVAVSNPERPALVSTYINDLSTSKTSTINRDRNIVDFREIDDIANQETLDNYVKRIANEANQVYQKFIFSTAVMPHHTYLDCLFIEHSGFGIADKYIEANWTINIGEGNMQHTCRRVVEI